MRSFRFLPDPFLGVLLATIALASLLPASGPAAGWISTLANAAIVLLFFLHGVRLPRENLLAAVAHWRLHALILGATYALFPLIGFGLSSVAPGLLPDSLWVGILFLCVLPSTVQSSIAFTSVGRGNVGAAVASAAASNLIGIGVTPLLLGLLVHAQPGESAVNFAAIWKIVLQLLLPFAVGHALRPWLGPWAARQKAILTYTDRATIVLAVYSAFSAAVIAGIWSQMPVWRLLILVLVCGVILALVIGVLRLAARVFGFSREDEVAIVFCGMQKSLVSGVPMARVLFAGPAMGAAVLPLMIYHQMQLMVCAWLARRYAARDGAPPEE